MRLNLLMALMHRGHFLRVTLLSVAAVVLMLAGGACADEPLSPDREALVALYNATDGDNWSVNTNWLSAVSCLGPPLRAGIIEAKQQSAQRAYPAGVGEPRKRKDLGIGD